MMDAEASYNLENEQQFWQGTRGSIDRLSIADIVWTELENIVSGPGDSHELIDNALRSYLTLTASFKRTACV